MYRHVCRHVCRDEEFIADVNPEGNGLISTMSVWPSIDSCVDICVDMCTDMCIDICIHMCIHMCTGAHLNWKKEYSSYQ